MTAAFDRALAHNPRVGIFFRLGVVMDDGQLFRMWLGLGDCEAGIDAEDGAGAVYRGMGEMLNVPGFQQLVNGTFERVTFSLSGVPSRVVELAARDSDDVKGVPLHVGLGLFDDDWQLIGQPSWLRRFTVDFLSISIESEADETLNTVALSCRSIFSARRRPGLSYYTDEDQQRRSPGDRFCEHVRRYAQGEEKAWPRA